MTNKWDLEFTVEKLQDQIIAAKNKYQELHWKVVSVDYRKSTKDIEIVFELDERYRVEGCRYLSSFIFDVSDCKYLKGRTEEEISKVFFLGERAIQWKDLDIQISLENLLMSIQLRENWLNSLK